MGQIWNAAKRGEGYQLARESNITWVIVILTTIFVVIFRFFSGRPMFGDTHRKTNATFTKPGTVLLQPKNRPPLMWGSRYCWSAMPEWQRAAIRVGFLVAVIGASWLYLFAQSHPFIAGSVLFAATLPVTRNVSRKWRARKFNRVYLKPLAKAAGPVLDILPNTPTHKWVSVSPDLPGLLPNLVKPMGPFETRIRQWYGQYAEPVVRYIPDRVMRAYWWATGHVAGVTKGWRRSNGRL